MKLSPPLEPMLSTSGQTIPSEMSYEPKWDGFRCLVFRNRDDVVLQSRSGKDIARFFPDLVDALLANTPPRCVLDGEIVVIDNETLDFDGLNHMLRSASHRKSGDLTNSSASYIAYDVLALDGEVLLPLSAGQRRKRLELALQYADAPVYLSPYTLNLNTAQEWLAEGEGVGLGGVASKPIDASYIPGERTTFTTECCHKINVVLGAWTEHSNSTSTTPRVGSLQVGLYDDDSCLQWMGAVLAMPTPMRESLVGELVPLVWPDDLAAEHPWSDSHPNLDIRRPVLTTHNRQTAKAMHLVIPQRVLTVTYRGPAILRFRHNPRIVSWRPDLDAVSCRIGQLTHSGSGRISDFWG